MRDKSRDKQNLADAVGQLGKGITGCGCLLIIIAIMLTLLMALV